MTGTLQNNKQKCRGSLSSTFERVMGLEPTISCLGSTRSTTELHPLENKDYSDPLRGCQAIMRTGLCNKSVNEEGSERQARRAKKNELDEYFRSAPLANAQASAQQVNIKSATSRSGRLRSGEQGRSTQGWWAMNNEENQTSGAWKRPSGTLKAVSQEAVPQRGSRRLLHGMARSFKNQAGQVEGQRERVRQEHGFGSVGQAKGS
jgi:hypothetical protein